jgi:hypothetical protein
MADDNQTILIGSPPFARIEVGGDTRKFIHIYAQPGFQYHSAYDFDNGRIEISIDPKPLESEKIQ